MPDTDRIEAKHRALRTLNSLQRLVLDLDTFTASRDMKNLLKAQDNLNKDVALLRMTYEDNSES